MTRFASTANQSEAANSAIRLFIACDLDFISGHVRAHDGLGTINFGGFDYLGVGSFGGIEIAEESISVIAKPVTISLSGVDPALVATAVTEAYQGRSATIYLGMINAQTNALIDTPETLWEGRMDVMTVSLGPETGSIKLNCEHRLRREPRIARYTDADQQIAHPGDNFFNLIGKIPGFKGTWGTEGVANDGGGSQSPTSNWQNWNGGYRW
jgi:hypothetical protein